MSVEPSMEEILSSIKRIIAEEEAPTGRRRATRPPAADDGDDDDEVLELSDPIPVQPRRVSASPPAPVIAAAPEESTADPMPAPTFPEPLAAATFPAPRGPATPGPSPDAPPADPILSPAAIDATRGALDSLSRLLVKPDPQGDGTLEGLVRDMLRPMLKDWLDARLPDMVEAMVSREIARISGQGR